MRNKPLFIPNGTLKVAMVAGEASADVLGAHLIEALLAKNPATQFAGIGGPRMVARGLRSIVSQEKLAVCGYIEVIKHLPGLLRIRRQLCDSLLADKPDIYIGIDAPDFNLGLEATLKRAGVPTVHYVSPSVWAWRPQRIEKMIRSVDHMLCLFPMEPPLYAKAGIPASYVGHPLASEIPLVIDKAAIREQLGLPDETPVFALLPGSRQSELAYMGPLLIETAKCLLEHFPKAQFLVPLATRITMDQFDSLLTEHRAWELPIRKLFGHAQLAMAASDVVLVTSGTATLEVALTKRPMVISYKLAPLTYYLVKRQLRLPFVGLPNILVGESVVPELLQHHATPDNLVREADRLYHDKAYQATLTTVFTALHKELRLNTSELAAETVFSLLR